MAWTSAAKTVPEPDYSSLDLPSPPAARPYVLLNMVMSADGKAVVDGDERGLGSGVDRQLMRQLRANADIVLSGASTLRATGTSPRLADAGLERLRTARGRSPVPLAAVLSRSGNLPFDRAFFTATDFDAVVFLSTLAPPARREAARATGRRVIDVPAGQEIPAMLATMRHLLDAAVLLVEGGPDLNAGFFALDVVDEYFVTLGPVVVGGRDTITAVEGASGFAPDDVRRLDLVSAHPNPTTGEVYVRYRARR